MSLAHHTLTEPASDAAIDTACRVLRLPTVRAQFGDTITRAERDHMTYRGFLADCSWPNAKKGQPLCLIGDSGTGRSRRGR